VSASPLGARTSGALIIRHTDWERAPPARSSPAPACASGNHPAPLVPAPSGGGLGWGRVGIPPGIARLQCSHRNWERAPPARRTTDHLITVSFNIITFGQERSGVHAGKLDSDGTARRCAPPTHQPPYRLRANAKARHRPRSDWQPHRRCHDTDC